MEKNFIHLNIHTQYSIVDSTIRIPELMKNCVSSEFPAVTITDQNGCVTTNYGGFDDWMGDIEKGAKNFDKEERM